MRKPSFISALISVALLLFATPSEAQRSETKYSRFGEIVLLKDFAKGSTIKLNGTTIHSTPELQHLSILQIIPTKNRDYIIIAENLGGSGTPDSYSIIAVGPNSFFKLFANIDLMASGNSFSIADNGEEIRFRLEDQGVFEMFAIISGDRLTVSKKAMTRPKSLAHEECQLLFTQVLSECASASRNEPCNDRLSNLSMASQRSFYYISKNVFSPAKAFEAICEAACKRRYVWIQYRDFAKNVCSFN